MSHIDGTSRVFALLGDPVSHSLSPRIQNAAMRAAGVDGAYVALRTHEEDLPGFIRGLSRAGGGGNVTLPHKEKAASVVDLSRTAVRRTGACNAFWLENGKVVGDNTDVDGFGRALREFVVGGAKNARVLLLGAGGAARAGLVALLDAEVDEIRLLNRSVERARNVSRRIGGERVRVVMDPTEIDGADFDLVVNATRLGLEPDDPVPLDLERLARAGAVMDMVYGAGGTPFTRAADALGIRSTDGREMLVQQAAAAWERWWEGEAPLDAMREALRGVEEEHAG